MKNFLLILIIGLLVVCSAVGQTISKSTISSSGKSQIQNGIEIDWTIGQLSIAYAVKGEYLQAGFQQNDDELIIRDDDGIIQAKIFPNPFSNILNIEIELVADLKINIYNILGQLVHQCPADQAEQIINTEAWSVGTYILAIEAPNNFRITEKLIKQE